MQNLPEDFRAYTPNMIAVLIKSWTLKTPGKQLTLQEKSVQKSMLTPSNSKNPNNRLITAPNADKNSKIEFSRLQASKWHYERLQLHKWPESMTVTRIVTAEWEALLYKVYAESKISGIRRVFAKLWLKTYSLKNLKLKILLSYSKSNSKLFQIMLLGTAVWRQWQNICTMTSSPRLQVCRGKQHN